MKVIDLLNDMAKGKINADNKYQFSYADYCTIRDFFDRYIVDEENLNLEIIEDTQKDNKIEKLNEHYYHDEPALIDDMAHKINEIIDRLNGESDE